MKKVIAVRGVSNSGKTASIKKALDVLKSEHGARVVRIIKDATDVIIVLDVNEVIIIIASAGDVEQMLIDLFDAIKTIKWDILVCATKSRGATVRFIERLDDYNITWVDKSWEAKNRDSANEATAREIVRRIV